MRIVHYLGVWHIFIAVLFLCAHRPFIALCHETGTSSPTTSGKPKSSSQSTSPTGSEANQAKVPSGGSDSEEDQEDTDSSDEDELGIKKDETVKDNTEQPIVLSGNAALEQDDTSHLSEDLEASLETDKEGVSEGDTPQQFSSFQDDKKTSADELQQMQYNLEISVDNQVVADDEDLEDDGQPPSNGDEAIGVSDGEHIPEESEKATAVLGIPVTNKPSTKPEIDYTLPNPLPVAAPATDPITSEQPSEVKTPNDGASGDKADMIEDTSKPDEGGRVNMSKTEQESEPVFVEGETVDKWEEGKKVEGKPGENVEENDEKVGEELTKKGQEVKTAEDNIQEEMPSFDEWKVKKLQEEEIKKQEIGKSSKSHAAPPVRPKFSLTENSKNHASSDCGAKLLSTNKEAQSAIAILNINPDLYMLNPCSVNIKFVVELCEPIQVKQIEIANYELFSSVPESFRVSISDRYPAREWHLLGIFQARNERVLQSFPLHDETMYAKYMKFEMLTFFGTEHYCPLSVLRVFGTNVVEEIEDANADDEDIALDGPPEVLPLHPTPIPDDDFQKNGILESARDVVLGIVTRAAKVLTGREDSDFKLKDDHTPCLPEDAPNNTSFNTSEVRNNAEQLPYAEHLEICLPTIYNQCVGVDVDFSSMRQLCHGHSCCFCPNYAERFEYCRRRGVSQDAQDEFQCCKDTSLCGLPKADTENVGDVSAKDTDADEKTNVNQKSIVEDSMIKEETKVDDGISLPKTESESTVERTENAVIEQTLTRTTVEITKKSDLQSKLDENSNAPPNDETLVITATPSVVKPTASVVINVSSLRDIEPTKSMQPAPMAKTESVLDSVIASMRVEFEPEMQKLEPTVDVNQGVPPLESSSVVKTPGIDEGDQTVINSRAGTDQELRIENESTTESESVPIKPVDKENTEGDAPDGTAKTDMTASAKITKPVSEMVGNGGSTGVLSTHQKESVFMRLNNRIKSLELNMSLSSRYLEELSLRYRKQMEEMQKAFNKTIKTLTENAQIADERDTQQQNYISKLEIKLADITSNLENTTQRIDVVIREVIERHLFLMFIEILVMSLLFLFCIGRRPARVYIPVENGVANHVKSPVHHVLNHHVGPPIPVAPPKAGSDKEAGRIKHASSRRRNRSLGECTPLKASTTNSGGGSCDNLLIIGHTTPYLEAITQVNDTDGVPRRKGKHKSRHKIAAKVSSATAIRETNGNQNGQPLLQNTQAGLLFGGSARKNDASNWSAFTNGTISRLFSSESIDRIEDLTGGAHPRQSSVHLKSAQHPTHIGPKQPHRPKQQKVNGSIKKVTPPSLKQPTTGSAILASSYSQPKLQGKGVDKKSRSAPGLQHANFNSTGLGKAPHPSGSSVTKRQAKKTSLDMNGKR